MSEMLHFSICGDFITNRARELYYQNNNLKGAIDILMSATQTDQLSKREHIGLCIDILDGKAEITGTYPGDDYGITETEENPSLGFMEHMTKITKDMDDTKRELDITYRKILFMIDYMNEHNKISDRDLARIDSAYYREYDEHFLDIQTAATIAKNNPYDYACVDMDSDSDIDPRLQSFLDRKRNEKKYDYDPEEDYGWLAPDGTYYPVPWGNHSEWATKYADEHYPFKDNAHMYWKTDANGKRHHYVAGDFLVYILHWVLLDSPHQGIATPKYDPARPLTKAQKEFLYQYYIDRGENKRANAIYAE